MKKVKLFTALVLTSFLINPATAQAVKNINDLTGSMEKAEQDCLDAGSNFVIYSQTFYNQIDSLLNVVYKALKTELTAEQFSVVKADQIIWLKKRDRAFKVHHSEIAKNDAGYEAGRSIAIKQDALFVKERVLYLAARLK